MPSPPIHTNTSPHASPVLVKGDGVYVYHDGSPTDAPWGLAIPTEHGDSIILSLPVSISPKDWQRLMDALASVRSQLFEEGERDPHA